MTLHELRSNLDVIIKKEVKGNRISPDDFNRVLESSWEAFFKRKLDIYLRSINGQLKDAEHDLRYIDPYVMADTGNALAAGVLDLTTIEANIIDIAAIIAVKGTYSAAYRKIDLVSPQVAMEVHHNLMGRRLTSFPVCYRIYTDLYFLPTDITSVDVLYVKRPDVPFLDYYIDVNGEVQYFDMGDEDHVWATGEYDSDGEVHTLYDDNYTPVTRELDEDPYYHYEFMMECLAQYALSLSNEACNCLVEYAEKKKEQINSR